jgi:hypothetical protein
MIVNNTIIYCWWGQSYKKFLEKDQNSLDGARINFEIKYCNFMIQNEYMQL